MLVVRSLRNSGAVVRCEILRVETRETTAVGFGRRTALLTEGWHLGRVLLALQSARATSYT